MTRRSFLAGSAAALFTPLAVLQPRGRLLGTAPFSTPRVAPLETLLGTGLDARLFTNLSTLQLGDSQPPNTAPVTPADRFFIRTSAPPATKEPATDRNWGITTAGFVRQPRDVGLDTLEQMSRPAGRYLIECAGNGDTGSFGLMSTADWEGVPVEEVLEMLGPPPGPFRILVSGVDDEKAPSQTSIPGASWIFSRDDLRHAVLALRMNGAPLPLDHGAPVRLVIPNWYGCACIKWVDRIEVVPAEALPTSQMSEYAARTHQVGSPRLARDYTPAVIDTAAMPVRVEKWLVNSRIVYRIVGIVWGGTKPTNALSIRFKGGGPWFPVENCPLPASALTWNLWTHTWQPEAPGRYELVLKVTDPGIRTRRLDLFFYARIVDIDEV